MARPCTRSPARRARSRWLGSWTACAPGRARRPSAASAWALTGSAAAAGCPCHRPESPRRHPSEPSAAFRMTWLTRSALGAGRPGDRPYVLTVGGFGQRLAQGQALVGGDEPVDQGNLLQAGDPDALAVFKDTHELAGVQQRVVGAGVQPGEPATEVGQRGPARPKVYVVQVGDLQLAAGAGLQ